MTLERGGEYIKNEYIHTYYIYITYLYSHGLGINYLSLVGYFYTFFECMPSIFRTALALYLAYTFKVSYYFKVCGFTIIHKKPSEKKT